jgi:cytoskeletal protein RodZ
MPEHDLEKLLGGFAADTLTPEEKQSLYNAALHDQQLFNALADEQALKELLADPDVRRRLLQALKQTNLSGTGSSLSWLGWFRRPAGLAFAGGLAAAMFAVVLGTKIYQDSLQQAAQSVASEEPKSTAPPPPAPSLSQPEPPHIAAPQAKVKESLVPAIDLAKKDASIDKRAKRERSAPQEQHDSDIPHASMPPQSERDEAIKQTEFPVAALGKAAVTDQKPAVRSSPSAAPAPAPMQAPANAPFAGAVAPAISARALFYAGDATRQDTGAIAPEKERAMKPLGESAPQANRLERKMDQFALAEKAADTASQLRPLGLRYSFVVRGTDGQDREVDAETASKSLQPVFLTVEANQDAYLQVWKTVHSSTPQLLLPEKKTGQISLRSTAGQRQHIPLPTESGPFTLTARLSRTPFGPITRQEAVMFDRVSPNQLQESITASGQAGDEERATYVINQDSSPIAQVSVEIPLSR